MVSVLMHGVCAASLFSTAIISLIIAIKRITLKTIGANWNYYLWFTIFIPWVAVWFSWYYMTVFMVLKLLTWLKPILTAGLTHSSPFKKITYLIINGTKYSVILTKLFFIVWLLGVVLSIVYSAIHHLHFVTTLKDNSRALNPSEADQINLLFVGKLHSKIYISSLITSAMLCNILKPVIYLPEDFFNVYSHAQQQYILKHELCHLQRKDVLANAFMLLFKCLNWFNPFFTLAYKHFRRAQELSCDAAVSKNFTLAEKKAYGYALLKTVAPATVEISATNCAWNIGTELKERCLMLKYHRTKWYKSFFGSVLLIFVFCITLAATSVENRDSLFFYSLFTAESSDFVIKLFNSTGNINPLHYSIKTSEGLITGQLLAGDDNGEFIDVKGNLQEMNRAMITLESTGKVVWQGQVNFINKKSGFYFKLSKLDNHFTVSTNTYAAIDAISFDVQSK